MLSKELSDEYRTVLWAIQETIRVRQEIDQMIDDSGGWPEAFKKRQ